MQVDLLELGVEAQKFGALIKHAVTIKVAMRGAASKHAKLVARIK